MSAPACREVSGDTPPSQLLVLLQLLSCELAKIFELKKLLVLLVSGERGPIPVCVLCVEWLFRDASKKIPDPPNPLLLISGEPGPMPVCV